MDSKKKVIIVGAGPFVGRGMGKSDLFNQLLKEYIEKEEVDVIYESFEDSKIVEDTYQQLLDEVGVYEYIEPPQVKVPKKQKNPPRSYGNTGKGKQRRW